jgi:hypothetical protein
MRVKSLPFCPDGVVSCPQTGHANGAVASFAFDADDADDEEGGEAAGQAAEAAGPERGDQGVEPAAEAPAGAAKDTGVTAAKGEAATPAPGSLPVLAGAVAGPERAKEPLVAVAPPGTAVEIVASAASA